MRKVTNFNDFLFNKLLEEINVKANELELILSPRLKNILKELNHKIADDLLALHKDSKREYKKTFLDLGSEPKKISFIAANKVPDLIEPEIVHGTYTRNPDADPDVEGSWRGEYELIDDEWKNPWIEEINHILDLHEIQFTDKNHPVWHKNRGEQDVVRFLNQMFPNKYELNVKREDRPQKPEDLESFRDMFVAMVESKSKMIVNVKGEEIKKYYNCSNYYKDTGTLGGSCMKDASKSNQLNIYTENPEIVSMLILYPEDIRDKIIGRAILWKLSRVDGEKVKDTYFMDRIYVASASDEYMYIDYAKAHGYYYKAVQTYGYDYDIINPKGESKKILLEADLKPKDYDNKYPYCDTMQFYDPDTGIITNNITEYTENGYGVLTDYNGPINYYNGDN